MEQLLKAFISYARADGTPFATKLYQALVDRNFKIWFDQSDIPPAVNWRQQVNEGIERAENFLLVITPEAVQSQYCTQELHRAQELNKRIIPLLSIRVPRDQRPDAIRNLNWIYFRNGLDDFNHSLQQLIDTLGERVDYVETHTQLLIQALDWSRNNRQDKYLLVGKHRRQAQSWLTYQYKEGQPPCLPTDLHCEFICESVKNAHNLMTQVFISYASTDKNLMRQVKAILMRAGFTVGNHTADLETGMNLEADTRHGIESTDNFVYLVSRHSVASEHCIRALTYAQKLHKRIFPLILDEVDPSRLPSQIQGLRLFDLSGSKSKNVISSGIDAFIKELHRDAYYYGRHKLLLVKALKWQQQNRNTSILLRGHNLSHYEAWLNQAQSRKEHPPLNIQKHFVAASIEQPAQLSSDVFISYSQADADFTRKLNEALQLQGRTTWFDQESIPPGTEFQQELYKGIENSDNFVFVISPQSIQSPYCENEIRYAEQLSKRIITVVYQSVPPSDLPQILSKVQWIDFNRHNADFYANFNELVRTLDTDREHVSNHTKWYQRAKEWEQNHKNKDLLLHGSEFAIAAQWLQVAIQEQKHPPVTALQQSFIAASKHAIAAEVKREKRRVIVLRSLLGLVSGALVVSVGLGIYAFYEYREATIGKVQSISQFANASFSLDRRLSALIEAIRAHKIQTQIRNLDSATQKQVDSALRLAVLGINEVNRFRGHNGPVFAVEFSPDGTSIASGASDNTIKLWNRSGELQGTFKGHRGTVTRISISPDNQTLASASEDDTIKLWDMAGNSLATLKDHSDAVWDVRFSSDGTQIASAGEDKTIKIWNREGQLQSSLVGHQATVWGVTFSPDNQTLASASADGTVKLWNPNGTLQATLNGHDAEVWCVTFSPDGQMLASAGEDNIIRLWDLDGTLINTLEDHRGPIWRVVFSPDGQELVSASWDNTIKLWGRDGTLLETIGGHQDNVNDVAFSPDGETIASVSSDDTVRLWRYDNGLTRVLSGHRNEVGAVTFSPNSELIVSGGGDNILKVSGMEGHLKVVLKGHQDRITAVDFAPNGRMIASGSMDNTVRLWDTTGQLLTTLRGHRNRVQSVAFSPDGRRLASGSADNSIKLWTTDGTWQKTLTGHNGAVTSLDFSPDGDQLVSGSWDAKIKLWSITGNLQRTIIGHTGAVTSVAFSPDGKTLASASEDNTVKLWANDGKLITQLRGHSDAVRVVKFSSDGTLLATAGADHTLKVWSRKGDLLATFSLNDSVRDVAFRPTDQSIAIAYLNHVIHLRNIKQIVDIDYLLAYGCNWLKDYLRSNPSLTESDRKLCDGIGKL